MKVKLEFKLEILPDWEIVVDKNKVNEKMLEKEIRSKKPKKRGIGAALDEKTGNYVVWHFLIAPDYLGEIIVTEV